MRLLLLVLFEIRLFFINFTLSKYIWVDDLSKMQKLLWTSVKKSCHLRGSYFRVLVFHDSKKLKSNSS